MTKTLEQVPGFDIDLIQDTDLFRSSIDAALLANWVTLRPQQTLVDLCSGSGIIGLSLAQKFQVQTTLFELQSQLAALAKEAVVHNQLVDKVTVYNNDIKEAISLVGHDTIDVITCNPPYFAKKDTPQLGKSLSKNIARHEIYFSQELLAQTAKALLKDNGVMYLVYRPDRLLELSQVLQKHNLPVKELLFVHPHQDDLANLVLIKCRKTRRNNGLKIWPSLTMYNSDGVYTPQLKEFLNEK